MKFVGFYLCVFQSRDLKMKLCLVLVSMCLCHLGMTVRNIQQNQRK